MISTHVLDVARGMPAARLGVELHRIEGSERALIASAQTDADGRIASAFASVSGGGTYELTFFAGAYFAQSGTRSLYGKIPVRFEVEDGQRYHIPLLLSPFGYSTYRGS